MTRSLYSNLLKAGWVVCKEEEKLVIDNNERVARKLEQLYEDAPGGRHENAEAFSGETENDRMDEDGAEGPEAALFADSEEGFQSGLSAQKVEVQEPVYEGPAPEELLEQAKEEAEAIRQAACREAEQLKSQAYEEGRSQGYQDGYEEGMAKIGELETELAGKEAILEQRYLDKMEELEPKFVDILNRIYERVFDVKFSDQKGLILYLLTNAMRGIEETKDFIIHVSPQDYKEVRAAKSVLSSESLVGGASVEIIEDMTLSKNECLIETGGGIFDCSLGTELRQLQRELELLSYEK
ncbi:MAG: hypothetical protein GX234_10190 [Clostridiales bacterium]|nr:hypothetical protein [Clostridiales bacterium]